MLKHLFDGLCGRARCSQRAVVVGLLMCLAAAAFAATPTITGVTAQQRYPWNGKVDISYTVTGDIAAETKQKALITSFKATATDKVANKTYTATKLSGDRALTAGTHNFVWDLDAEGLSFKSSNVVFMVSCETTPATYCVIDLSGGASASSYPVTYLASPPSGGFNVDAYKTTKLVLRRIEAGSYKMCGQYNVTLTKSFFCGIFEVTQKQYTQIMGSNPSTYNGDKRPVEKVSWGTIRGNVTQGVLASPTASIDSKSFLGKMRSRTSLNFDLPTEAQWEYACRAGTTSDYNNGGSTEADLKELARYSGNNVVNGYSVYHAVVGSYTANAWGLYDMHGNVCEWCRDSYSSDSLSNNMTDPLCTDSGSMRVVRGGSWTDDARECCSSYRGDYGSGWNETSDRGFRLAITLSN